ncbi:MAG: GldM family protein [Bacteroidota bacterium]|nr:GldM family protein [Bacteroidota bacterium]
MRNGILAGTSFLLCLTAFGQNILTNKEPSVSIDGFRTLFLGIDNQVTISTGKYDSVQLEIKNGTIKHLDKGHYLIRPAYDRSDVTILKIKTPKKTYQFIFQVRNLPDPELRIAGYYNEDRVLTCFKCSWGVSAILGNFFYELDFSVLSFDITFSGEGFDDTISHRNNGAAWDSVTRKLIDQSRVGSKIVINHAYIKCPDGRTKRLWDELTYKLN